MSDLGGVWRTVGGRRIFIKDGEDLETAMKRSGKFKFSQKGLTEEAKKKLKELEKDEKFKKEFNDLLEKSVEKENKYSVDKHEGFGDYNKDYVPVYNNDIDYTGDFSRANLSTLDDEELIKAINKQTELYQKAVNEDLGDQRTRNGRMNKIFNTAKIQQYDTGSTKLLEEFNKRDLPRYEISDTKNKDVVLVSSPTKEIALRQLNEMYETDKKLKKFYGWKSLPEYEIKKSEK